MPGADHQGAGEQRKGGAQATQQQTGGDDPQADGQRTFGAVLASQAGGQRREQTEAQHGQGGQGTDGGGGQTGVLLYSRQQWCQ